MMIKLNGEEVKNPVAQVLITAAVVLSVVAVFCFLSWLIPVILFFVGGLVFIILVIVVPLAVLGSIISHVFKGKKGVKKNEKRT